MDGSCWTDELKKIKEILKDKLIIRIDRTDNKKEFNVQYIIIFVNPERKQMGHCILKIPFTDEKFLNGFKKILIDKFDISIKGFKNWKKAIKEY